MPLFKKKGSVRPLLPIVKKYEERLKEYENLVEPDVKERRKAARKLVNERKRDINLYWKEKILVIVEAFQLFGLTWQLSQPWPWPARWLHVTRWTLIFNLDFVGMLPKGAAMGATGQPFSMWGEMDNYWIYALVYSLLPIFGLIYYTIHKHTLKKFYRHVYYYEKKKLQNQLFFLFQFLYLPIGLATFRLWNCNVNEQLSIDPNITCYSQMHWILLIGISGVLGSTFLLFFPFLLHYRINRFLIYQDIEQHENFLQMREFEYMIGSSNEYILLQCPLHASYHRKACHLPIFNCFLKLSLLSIFIFIRPLKRDSIYQGIQGTIFFCLFTFYAFYRSCLGPFRIHSTYRIMFLVDWLVAFNGLYAALAANKVHSALTVATSVVASLSFVHTCCGIYFGYLIVHLYKQYMMWKTGWKQNINDGWPVHKYMNELVDHVYDVEKWVTGIQGAQACLEKAYFSPPEMKPILDLSHYLELISSYSKDSADIHHLLHEQLYDLRHQLLQVHMEASATTIVMINPELEKNIEGLRSVLDRREDQQLFMNPQKKHIFSRLQALNTWIGDREIDYVDVNDQPALQNVLTTSSNSSPSSSSPRDRIARVRTSAYIGTFDLNNENELISYSKEFLTHLEWNKQKLYCPADIEDWIMIEWLISIIDTQQKIWISMTAIEFSASEQILKVKVPNRLNDKHAYFIGFISLYQHQHSDQHESIQFVKCLDSSTNELFGQLKHQMEQLSELPSSSLLSSNVQDEVMLELKEKIMENSNNDKINLLFQETKALLDASDTTIGELQSCQKQWRKYIKEWEKNYEEEYGLQPSASDKKRIKTWYEQYQLLKKAFEKAQQQYTTF